MTACKVKSNTFFFLVQPNRNKSTEAILDFPGDAKEPVDQLEGWRTYFQSLGKLLPQENLSFNESISDMQIS